MPKESELYALRRKFLKEKRELRKKIVGGDESAFQRTYTELTKTRRAIKVEAGLSKSKASGNKGEDTSIEIFVENILKEFSVKYTKQKRVRYLNYDFYLNDFNVIIQVEGCYFHACPVCYPAGPKNKMQEKGLKKDEISKQFAEEAGMPLVRIWEHEIKETPENVKKLLMQYRK